MESSVTFRFSASNGKANYEHNKQRYLVFSLRGWRKVFEIKRKQDLEVLQF